MPELPKRTLGRTGMDVTTLGYGAMELRGAPRGRDVSDEQAQRILNAVLDSGINFIDTSIDYGVAEERIGNFISHRRDEFFLASKCGCLAGDLAHNPPPVAEMNEHGALEELKKLQSEGKVRYIGVSGTIPNLKEQIETGIFDAFQIPYSAMQREHEMLIEHASRAGADRKSV